MTIQEVIDYLLAAEATAEANARKQQVKDGIDPNDGRYHPTDAYVRGALSASTSIAASYLKHVQRGPERL